MDLSTFEETFTFEDIVKYLGLSNSSVNLIKTLKLEDDFVRFFEGRNDINFCKQDLKCIFSKKAIIGYMTSLDDVVVLDSNVKPESMILFIEGDEFSKENVEKALEVVKNNTGVNVNCYFGFNKSDKNRVIGLLTGN